MSIRAVFRNQDNEWRSGWRIAAMFVLLAGVIIGVNAGWRALGLPGQNDTGPWLFMAFAMLVAGAAFTIIVLLLRFFEQRGPAAIGMPFSANAGRRVFSRSLGGVCAQGLPVTAAFDRN